MTEIPSANCSSNSGPIVSSRHDRRKEGTLLQYADITVPESEKRVTGSLNIREHYTVYLVEIKAFDPEFEAKLNKLETVWHRYTDFEQLHHHLTSTYPAHVVPPLPEKRALYTWQRRHGQNGVGGTASGSNSPTGGTGSIPGGATGPLDTFDPDFVDRRRAGLENFLLRVAAHPVLSSDKQFLEFLAHDERWKESLKTNGYFQYAESKLRQLSVAVRLRTADPRFDAVRLYSVQLSTALNALLKARSRHARATYTVNKLHANYGRVLSEWSAVEDRWPPPQPGGSSNRRLADALQRAGHYMDSVASSVDSVLEDEEIIADQLKEYLFYGDSLQVVCRHQDELRLAVDSAEDHVQAKTADRTRAESGRASLMSRLFGAVDTEEVRELKVNMLDQEVAIGTREVSKIKEEMKKFNSDAITDIETFQQQKVLDLKDTLASYAFLQLKSARKGLYTWTQIRDCLQSI